MTANHTLIKQRGIDEQSVKEINRLHEKLEELMGRASLGVFNQDVYDEIEKLEFQLQALWKFDQDQSFHTWKNLYKFRCQWANRRFQCKTTGEIFVIPDNVQETDCFFWGKAMVDTGRLGFYSRFSNVIEISNNSVQTDE